MLVCARASTVYALWRIKSKTKQVCENSACFALKHVKILFNKRECPEYGTAIKMKTTAVTWSIRFSRGLRHPPYVQWKSRTIWYSLLCLRAASTTSETPNRCCIVITQTRCTHALIKMHGDNRTRQVYREITGDSGHEYKALVKV